jgi:DNA binding domain, excisionase family
MIWGGISQGGDVEARERLLTPGEVATLFRVDPKTVTRWAAAGRISSIRTPGGHRRFRETEVRALLAGEPVMPRSLPAEPAGPDEVTSESVAPKPRTPAAEPSSAATR